MYVQIGNIKKLTFMKLFNCGTFSRLRSYTWFKQSCHLLFFSCSFSVSLFLSLLFLSSTSLFLSLFLSLPSFFPLPHYLLFIYLSIYICVQTLLLSGMARPFLSIFVLRHTQVGQAGLEPVAVPPQS